MSDSRLLAHLEALVACDTQNPPRAFDGDSPVFRYCSEVVGPSFDVRVWDHADGHVTWYAVRGAPRILFNVHLDTVPVGDGWSSDPHRLRIEQGRAYGRGACDIKGAAAALLALAERGAENLALLFTSDEEGAGGCCVARFLDSGEAERFDRVVVAEPTSCEAVLGHRGYLSVKARFRGTPGHSSEARALGENANHQMARWAARALQLAEDLKSSPDDPGACLNIGLVEGGSKSNVIAGSAFVHWSARLRPGESTGDFLRDIKACVDPDARVNWEVPFSGEPLPAAGQDDAEARRWCETQRLPVAGPVDFWTEASLFSAAGMSAVVLGPGRIREAHQTDEWVALAQLDRALELYGNLVNSND